MQKRRILAIGLTAIAASFLTACNTEFGVGDGESGGGGGGGGGGTAKYPTLNGDLPIVIGHRGAAGLRPDHTLEGYLLAMEQGAHFIEPDIVVTKDGELVARHEPNITLTTNVATLPQFADRETTKIVDGIRESGWFVSDFTLAELKTLRARQPFKDRDQQYNDRFSIPTLKEIIAQVKQYNSTNGKNVGLYIETKHPTYHEKLGLPIEDKLVQILKDAGYTSKTSRAIIQSFEVGNLKALRKKTDLRLVQLLDGNDVKDDGSIDLSAPYGQPYDLAAAGDKTTYLDMQTKDGLAKIKEYADGIGPWKTYIVSYKMVDKDGDGKPDDLNGDGKNTIPTDRVNGTPTSLVTDAHAANLFVHPFTFRSEKSRLVSDYKGNPSEEYKLFYKLGVDGVFSDFPADALKAR